jgi:hypothetical protein
MMSDKQFKENFRVERSTFLSLINQIGPFLEKLNTNYRTSIPVKQRIACALYTLGSSSELRTIGHLFGIDRNTAREILHEFCSVVVHLFFKRFIKFPATPQEIQTTINGFQDKFNYPVCLGALDGTHIPIKPPLGSETDYFNFKKYHSVIMLATVNSDLLFTYVNIGAPGRCNDASIFNRCILSEVIEDPIYANHFIMVNNTKIQSHLIADSAFALNRTVLKPFADRADLPKCHSTFNYRLSRARCSVERAFGALKNRFRLLHKKIEFKLCNTTNIIKTAAILHNLCVMNNDNEEIDWDIPVTIHKKPACNIRTNHGADIRHALVNYFIANPL